MQLIHAFRWVITTPLGLAVHEVRMHAHDLRAAVVDEIDEVFRRQPIVEWNDHRADLRHGVILFEMVMRVQREGRHAIALLDSEHLERRGPAIAASAEFGVREADVAIYHRLASGM